MYRKAIAINKKLKGLKWHNLFLTLLLIDTLYQIVSAIIINVFFPETFSHMQALTEGYDFFVQFFLLVLIAPFLETALFQMLVIEGFIRLKIRPIVAVIVSAVLFSLAHSYNAVYMLAVFPAGLIFGYYYYILRTQDKAIAFLSVAALHAAVNFLTYINNYFLVPWLG